MPRPHAPFCDLRAGSDHGPLCISRPIARQVVAASEDGGSVEYTVDIAARRADAHAPRLVRLIGEPQDIMGRFVSLASPGAARQIAAALIVAAGQAEELNRDVSRPRELY